MQVAIHRRRVLSGSEGVLIERWIPKAGMPLLPRAVQAAALSRYHLRQVRLHARPVVLF